MGFRMSIKEFSSAISAPIKPKAENKAKDLPAAEPRPTPTQKTPANVAPAAKP